MVCALSVPYSGLAPILVLHIADRRAQRFQFAGSVRKVLVDSSTVYHTLLTSSLLISEDFCFFLIPSDRSGFSTIVGGYTNFIVMEFPEKNSVFAHHPSLFVTSPAPFKTQFLLTLSFRRLWLSTNYHFGLRERNSQLPFSVPKGFALLALSTEFLVCNGFRCWFLSRKHPSRDLIFFDQNLAQKCQKLSHHMTSLSL